MEDRKRKAEFQLTSDESKHVESGSTTTPAAVDKEINASASSGFGGFGGFSAYSKINPFAAAMGTDGFKNVFSKTNDSVSSAPRIFGKLNTEMPPPIVVPSPRESPKVANPFSSPSPAHNPFMTIVESKDELWQAMAKDKLSADEARKSCFFNDDYKNSLLSSSNKGASFGSTGFGSSSSVAVGNGNDEDEDEAESGDNDADNDRADSPAFTKYAMPENVTIVTGEEQEECLMQVRAKLFRLNTLPSKTTAETASSTAGEWVEVGIGPVKLLRPKQSLNADGGIVNSSAVTGRLVMRREEKKGGIGTKLLLNVRLDQFANVSRQGDRVVRVTCVNFVSSSSTAGNTVAASDVVSGDSSAATKDSNSADQTQRCTTPSAAQATMASLHTYLLKTKNSQECDDLIDIASDLISTRSQQVKQQQQQQQQQQIAQTSTQVEAPTPTEVIEEKIHDKGPVVGDGGAAD